VRQSIRGYADGVIEQVADRDDLSKAAVELADVLELIDGSQDLRRTLMDPGVAEAARHGVLADLLPSRLHTATFRLLNFIVEADRATEFREDLEWLAARIDAASNALSPVGDFVLGRVAAGERLDGYATALLEQVEDKGAVENIEDELFRFMRVVNGSEELRTALSSRDVSAAARRALVIDLLHRQATPTTVTLAAYVTRVGRPRDYEALLGHLVDRVAAESNRRLADVRAAVDLDDEQRRQLAAALGRVAGRTVEVRVTIDPTVLGGFVATIGDLVVDGSMRHRLDLLKERLDMPEAQITIGDPS